MRVEYLQKMIDETSFKPFTGTNIENDSNCEALTGVTECSGQKAQCSTHFCLNSFTKVHGQRQRSNANAESTNCTTSEHIVDVIGARNQQPRDYERYRSCQNCIFTAQAINQWTTTDTTDQPSQRHYTTNPRFLFCRIYRRFIVICSQLSQSCLNFLNHSFHCPVDLPLRWTY